MQRLRNSCFKLFPLLEAETNGHYKTALFLAAPAIFVFALDRQGTLFSLPDKSKGMAERCRGPLMVMMAWLQKAGVADSAEHITRKHASRTPDIRNVGISDCVNTEVFFKFQPYSFERVGETLPKKH